MHVVISMFFIVSTAPIPPVLSAVYSVDSTSITVIWNKPIEVNGALTIYTISYTVDDSSLMNVTVLFNGQQVGKIFFYLYKFFYAQTQSHTITELLPYQLVTVTVTATNDGGTSDPSNEVSGRTGEAGMITTVTMATT